MSHIEEGLEKNSPPLVRCNPDNLVMITDMDGENTVIQKELIASISTIIGFGYDKNTEVKLTTGASHYFKITPSEIAAQME